MTDTNAQLLRRRKRVRSRISGTTERPRLSVKVSLRHIIAQVIDDTNGTTIAHVTTVGSDAKGTMTEKAAWVGRKIALASKDKNVVKIAFDRNGRIYHGRLSALADAARKEGLEF